MEEVWKDIINLPSTPSLPLHPHPRPNPQPCILPETSNQSSSSNDIFLQDFLAGTFKDAPADPNTSSSLPPKTLQPPISVSLNSVGSQSNNNINQVGVLGAPCSRKQASDGGADRRQRRMMKNRESAARSRARKQAYTRELEQAIELLSEENAKLKKEGDKMRLAMFSQASPKNTLQRSWTAPF